MMRRLTALVAVVLAATTACLPGPDPSSQPDILMVVLDDATPGQVAAGMPRLMGRLGTDGWWTFTQAISQDPLCGPARATLLTGLVSDHHKVTCNGKGASGGWPSDCQAYKDALLLQEWMQIWAPAYTTSMVGSWFTFYPCSGEGSGAGWPVPAGWDDWHAFSRAQQRYSPFYLVEGGQERYFPAVSGTDDDYSTNVLAARALDFWRGCASPCFQWFAPAAPHHPWTPPEFPEATGVVPDPPSYLEGCPGRDPATDKPAWYDGLTCSVAGWAAASGTATLPPVDVALDRIIALLQAQGRWDRTVVIVVSDQGIQNKAHRWSGKEVAYEESVRVPLYLRLPGTTGGTIDRLVTLADVHATLTDLMGVRTERDGLSLLRLVAGESWGRTEAYMAHHRVQSGVPFGPWRAIRQDCAVSVPCLAYVRWADGTEELYDLGADPFELTNLAPIPGRWPGDPSRAADLDAVRARLDELVAAL
jgi:arylsulfatase A-like enzyme